MQQLTLSTAKRNRYDALPIIPFVKNSTPIQLVLLHRKKHMAHSCPPQVFFSIAHKVADPSFRLQATTLTKIRTLRAGVAWDVVAMSAARVFEEDQKCLVTWRGDSRTLLNG